MVKRRLGFVKVRYRGLQKHTAQFTTSFAWPNLWMAGSELFGFKALCVRSARARSVQVKLLCKPTCVAQTHLGRPALRQMLDSCH